ncbi:hypothetical protein E8E11_010658 [Didymella keratinophila]|nr:hypothetical protein E8E11_010658 [Didymella keratinophila]
MSTDDSVQSIDHFIAHERGIGHKKDASYRVSTAVVFDTNHPTNPTNASLNVGLLFAWSALCEKHDLAQHHVHLDDRIRRPKDLERICDEDGYDQYDNPLWHGVSVGRKKMEALSEMKMESSIWSIRTIARRWST